MPEVDSVVGRTKYDNPKLCHVCEHIAVEIRDKTAFMEGQVLDSGAIDGFRIACHECEMDEVETRSGLGEKWLACSDCATELGRQRGWIDAGSGEPALALDFRELAVWV